MVETAARQSGARDNASSQEFWLGPNRCIEIAENALAPGINEVELEASTPCFATLHVQFEDWAEAGVMAPLEYIGQNRYRVVLSLRAPARNAWIEVFPAPPDATFDASARPVSLVDTVAHAARAALRHLTRPALLLAKARQVMQGGGNLVFSGGAHVADAPFDYRRWQQAFESPEQTGRLRAEIDRFASGKHISVLAILTRWNEPIAGLEDLIASLSAGYRSEVHLLTLGNCDERVITDRIGKLIVAHTHLEMGGQAALPLGAIAEHGRAQGAMMAIALDRPGRFHPLAAGCLALALAGNPDAVAAYADHDHLEASGQRAAPVFKPSWSPDYAMARDYVALPLAFSLELMGKCATAGAGSGQCAGFAALMGQALAAPGGGNVVHVPRVLFHAAREFGHNCDTEKFTTEASVLQALLGPQARVMPVRKTSHLRVKRTLPADARVSVLLPTKDNPVMLEAACRSVERATGIEAELIVIDNGAESDEQAKLLARLAAEERARVVQVHEPFNFSKLINRGRAAASGNVLLLLNDDVEALDDDWLAEMVAQAMRPDIGCVGALLLYPDGTVQHAGVMLGINGGAGHAFRFAPQDADPEAGRLQVVREVSAVTAACLAVKTSVFDTVGGFAEDLPVTLNDVDFCLRVREAGLRNLFTPQARLIHRESTSRGLDASPAKLRRLSRETSIYIDKWGRRGLTDPYISPFTSIAHEDCRPRRL